MNGRNYNLASFHNTSLPFVHSFEETAPPIKSKVLECLFALKVLLLSVHVLVVYPAPDERESQGSSPNPRLCIKTTNRALSVSHWHPGRSHSVDWWIAMSSIIHHLLIFLYHGRWIMLCKSHLAYKLTSTSNNGQTFGVFFQSIWQKGTTVQNKLAPFQNIEKKMVRRR